MYGVYFVNHFYGSASTFKSEAEALEYAKGKGFEAAIFEGESHLAEGAKCCGYWSYLKGYEPFVHPSYH